MRRSFINMLLLFMALFVITACPGNGGGGGGNTGGTESIKKTYNCEGNGAPPVSLTLGNSYAGSVCTSSYSMYSVVSTTEAGNYHVSVTDISSGPNFHLDFMTSSNLDVIFDTCNPSGNSITCDVHFDANVTYEIKADNTGSGGSFDIMISAPTTTVLPGTPSSVVATPGVNDICLSWASVPEATSYDIYRSTIAGHVPFGSDVEVSLTTSKSTVFDDNAVTAGTTYYYCVSAVNANGEGNCSAEVSAVPIAPSSAPDTPTGVQAIASAGTSSIYKTVTISWASVTNATGYNIYWSTSSPVTAASNSITLIGASTSYTQTGLTPAVYYYYKVSATDAAGESGLSSEVSAMPQNQTSMWPYTYNFNNGTLQGWTASGSWAAVLDPLGGFLVTDSPNVNYGNSSNTWIVSPPIGLSGTSAPKLKFSHYYNIDSTTVGASGDNGWVEISKDSGSTWTVLNAGYQGIQAIWVQDVYDLTPYKAGAPALIRFRLQTDSANVADGWYIDDIVITAN